MDALNAVDEDDAAYLVGVGLGVGPRDQTAEGVPDHDVRSRHLGRGQCVVQLGDQVPDGSRLGDGCAPVRQRRSVDVAQGAWPVVGADPVARGQRRRIPAVRWPARPG